MTSIFLASVLALAGVAQTQEHDRFGFPELSAFDQAVYKSIWEPRVVGAPPANAYRSLSLRPGGEIRHYGWIKLEGKMRRVFVSSDNCGLTWRLRAPEGTDYPGPMVKSPWSGDWVTILGGWTVDHPGGYGSRPMRCLHAANGPADGVTAEYELPVSVLNYNRQMVPLLKWKRWLVPGATGRCVCGQQKATVALSDDDGHTWRVVVLEKNVTAGEPIGGDKMLRWDDGACEPAVVELSDGTLVMMVRTARDHHYRYVSRDGGDTWEGPERAEGFYSSNTMPTFLKLRDGRILFIWNNTQQLTIPAPEDYPEVADAGRRGIGQFVFTNRDALHCAISEDDGKTWIGFREILLNDVRNCGDLRQRGNSGIGDDNDKSVHQSQALELPEGKILVSAGQNPASRRLIIFDVRWLYETSRTDDFHHGYAGLSNHLYVKSLSAGSRGWAGHCAWNRVDGAAIVREPDTDRVTCREVLQICRLRNPRLVSDLQGVAWNFPAGKKGRVELDCRIDGEGFRLSLCDRWLNPCDECVAERSPLSVPVEAADLGGAGRWRTLAVEWDWDAETAVLVRGDSRRTFKLRKEGFSPYGLSYLHLQTLARGEDPKGAYFREFRKTASELHRLKGGSTALLEGRPAWPLPMDYDGDGVLDLVVTSPGTEGGTWFFRRRPDATSPTALARGAWICSGRRDAAVSSYDGKPVVLQPAKATWKFSRDLFTSELDIWGTTKICGGVRSSDVRANVWRFVDYDGDGKEELAAGLGGKVFLMTRESRGGFGPEAIYASAQPLKTRTGKTVGATGGPFPMFADFDRDGDLDLLCGASDGGFFYFRNIGTRQRPAWEEGVPLQDAQGETLLAGVRNAASVALPWDGDQTVDLICGGEDGRVLFMRGLGADETGVPRFAPPQPFVSD